jgi:hypothetical protein
LIIERKGAIGALSFFESMAYSGNLAAVAEETVFVGAIADDVRCAGRAALIQLLVTGVRPACGIGQCGCGEHDECRGGKRGSKQCAFHREFLPLDAPAASRYRERGDDYLALTHGSAKNACAMPKKP